MANASSMTWDSLRREARRLEGKIETSLRRYEKLATSYSGNDASSSLSSINSIDAELGETRDSVKDEILDASAESQRLLERLREVAEAMAGCGKTGAAARAQVQRCREVLVDFQADFRKTQKTFNRKRETAELFREVHAKNDDGSGAYSATEHLLRERNAVTSSQRNADSIYSQALGVREALTRQRQNLAGAGGKLLEMGKTIPGVNNLMSLITKKRTRDNTILAIVIAICMCFTIWYWLRK